jgi:molybdopterin converting factor small subunit
VKIKVELQAYLEKYSPNDEGVFEYEVPDGASVQDVINALGVPDEMANVIIVSNQNVDPSHPVAEGDHVTLIPPLAGG